MLSAKTPFEQSLMNQLQHVASESEASNVIEAFFREQAQKPNQSVDLNSFAVKMKARLEAINPLLVEDAEKWNIIQAAKVIFHRMSCKYTSQVY
jgi:hypothetical protein